MICFPSITRPGMTPICTCCWHKSSTDEQTCACPTWFHMGDRLAMLDGTDAHDEKSAGVLSVETYMACFPHICLHTGTCRAQVSHRREYFHGSSFRAADPHVPFAFSLSNGLCIFMTREAASGLTGARNSACPPCPHCFTCLACPACPA